MMTTSGVFGISQAGKAATQPQAQPVIQTQESVDIQKFQVLKEAIEKFLKKEITKDELVAVKESLS
jgi:hypothetical protein